jgi:PAS domain S-box-containing protein
LRALDQTIQFWSRGAENLFGWSREEAHDKKATDLHFREAGPGDQAMLAVISEGVWAGEVELHTKSGRKVLVESRWTLIRDTTGAPKAILDLSTDVTEKRRVEAGLLRAQRLESIGTLAGGIAHDLNNILAPIILSADMLKSRVISDEDRELVDSVGASARRGADVVRQILSFARGAESTRVPLNVRHLFPEIRKIVTETFPRNIKCRTSAPGDLWTIHADPTQLHQVLLNLCLNARDAMPEGGLLRMEAANVEIDSTFAGFNRDVRPGAYVQVRVSDTGTGIPEEIRGQIFDPFFTTKSAAAGTGLGLSTLKAIVRSHGGFVQMETEMGKGTTLLFHMPAEAKQSSTFEQREKPELPRGKGELILVIDDEKSVGSITRQSLESAGYRAIVAGDGAEGVSLFVQNQEEIVLVLTDMMMPVMDGAATIKAIHRIAPEAKIVAMSGVAAAHTSLMSSAPTVPSDVVNFLLKPFTLESLLLTVQDALEK